MKFKVFLKRFNRGIALGIAVVIGFSAYVASDSISFKKSKPEIKEFLKDFVTEYETLALTSEDYRNIDLVEYSQEEKDRKSKEFNIVANKYWVYYSLDGTIYNGDDKEYFLMSIEMMTERNISAKYKNGVGFVDNYMINVDDNIKITKKGPNLAEATMKCNMVCEYVGNPIIAFPGGTSLAMYLGNGHFYGDKEEEYELSDERMKAEVEFPEIHILLYKKAGEWKILGMNNRQRSAITYKMAEEGNE